MFESTIIPFLKSVFRFVHLVHLKKFQKRLFYYFYYNMLLEFLFYFIIDKNLSIEFLHIKLDFRKFNCKT